MESLWRVLSIADSGNFFSAAFHGTSKHTNEGKAKFFVQQSRDFLFEKNCGWWVAVTQTKD